MATATNISRAGGFSTVDRDARHHLYPGTINQFMAMALLGLEAPPNGLALFVDSNTGSADADGFNPEKPLNSYGAALRRIDSLAAAHSSFVAQNLVFGLPGHSETVTAASSATAGVHFATAGTKIVQLGEGAAAAKITVGTVVGADINFAADDCYIEGGKIVAGLDNLTAPIDIDEDRCGLRGVELEIGSGVTDAPTNWIAVGAAKDRIAVERCYLNSAVTGSASLLAVSAAATNLSLKDNFIRGDFSTAVVNNTSAAFVNLVDKGNHLENLNSAGINYVFVAGASRLVEMDGEEWRHVFNTADFETAGHNEAAEHEVFTVTGDVRVRLLNDVTETLDSTGDGASIQYGVTGDTDQFIAASAEADVAAGRYWQADPSAASGSMIERDINGGADIGYEITGEALTDGGIDFHCYYQPRGAGGKLVAATIASGAI